MAHPPGQCRRKRTGVNFVSRGRNQCHASKPHQIKPNHNTWSTTQFKRMYKDTNLDWAEMFFQMLQILEELSNQRS